MLNVIRAVFVAVCGLLGFWVAERAVGVEVWQGIAAGVGVALALVLLEAAFARRVAGVVATLAFALVAGFVASHLLVEALLLIPMVRDLEPQDLLLLQASTLIVSTFMAILIILHVRDDFKFVIPFIEFSREARLGRPLVVDTSAVVDGRLADLLATGVLDAPLVVPRFVLRELHALADSADKSKRMRGRRGLEMLERMRERKGAELRIHDAPVEGEGVDQKVVRLAKVLDARIVTTDIGLAKVAEVQGIEVVNLNAIALAMRPPVLQGDRITVAILKPGENPGQGVGYLEDGSMVVGEDCAQRIGQEVELVVTNIIQSPVGRMVFGRPAGESGAGGARKG
jgi:uncharacterized protein YacL